MFCENLKRMIAKDILSSNCGWCWKIWGSRKICTEGLPLFSYFRHAPHRAESLRDTVRATIRHCWVRSVLSFRQRSTISLTFWKLTNNHASWYRQIEVFSIGRIRHAWIDILPENGDNLNLYELLAMPFWGHVCSRGGSNRRSLLFSSVLPPIFSDSIQQRQ